MALDVLRSARVRRESYVGPWLPEPAVAATGETAADPADKVTLADEVGYAMLVVMETLSPAERTAFVLHDLFGVTFDEVAAIVGRAPAAVRQLASRARRHVRGQSPWPATDAAEHRRVVDAFNSAARSGDVIDSVLVNGAPGFAVYHQGELVTVVSVTVAAGRVTRLDFVRAPDKLAGLAG
jgi:RNA polymerase sigma-70 factor (ECF subfamily)